MSFSMLVAIFGGIGLFLYGMTVMSDALQRVGGERLRSFLGKLTKNRVSGLLTGVGITTLIQSSSATTVMLVGFVSAGLLELTAAIGVVMGANIGSTVTGWIVALIGFKFDIATLALPAVAVGFFAKFLGRETVTQWGGVLIGFGLLFLGLTSMTTAAQSLRDNPEMIAVISKLNVTGPGSLIVAILTGGLITMLIQASSATMALTMVLAVNGAISFPTAAALILGENIGTTVTANLAALGAARAARQTAFAHFLFNFLGVVWVAIFFWPILHLIDAIVPGEAFGADLDTIPDHMATFHSIFNITNALLFLPFVKFLAYCARRVFPEQEESVAPRLQFITYKFGTPTHVAMEEARRALHSMGTMAADGFDAAMSILSQSLEDAEFEELSKKITRIEERLDEAEEDLITFTVDLGSQGLTHALAEEMNHITGSAHDFERIGDHLDSILRQARNKRTKGLTFSEEALNDLAMLAGEVRENLLRVTDNIIRPSHLILSEAKSVEMNIDLHRAELRKKHINRLRDQQCTINSGILFIELLTSLERIGDHAFNVAEDFYPRSDA